MLVEAILGGIIGGGFAFAIWKVVEHVRDYEPHDYNDDMYDDDEFYIQ